MPQCWSMRLYREKNTSTRGKTFQKVCYRVFLFVKLSTYFRFRYSQASYRVTKDDAAPEGEDRVDVTEMERERERERERDRDQSLVVNLLRTQSGQRQQNPPAPPCPTGPLWRRRRPEAQRRRSNSPHARPSSSGPAWWNIQRRSLSLSLSLSPFLCLFRALRWKICHTIVVVIVIVDSLRNETPSGQAAWIDSLRNETSSGQVVLFLFFFLFSWFSYFWGA